MNESLAADRSEFAALYAAGALSPEERASFEARLFDGDAALWQALEPYGPILQTLFESFPVIEPSPRIKQTLIERLANEPPRLPTGLQINRNRPDAWKKTRLPGVEVRILNRDIEQDLQTMLLRMRPGTILPHHQHGQAEECYVVEGDIESYGIPFSAGDYMRAEAGSDHEVCRTDQGCTLLITGSVLLLEID